MEDRNTIEQARHYRNELGEVLNFEFAKRYIDGRCRVCCLLYCTLVVNAARNGEA